MASLVADLPSVCTPQLCSRCRMPVQSKAGAQSKAWTHSALSSGTNEHWGYGDFWLSDQVKGLHLERWACRSSYGLQTVFWGKSILRHVMFTWGVSRIECSIGHCTGNMQLQWKDGVWALHLTFSRALQCCSFAKKRVQQAARKPQLHFSPEKLYV